MATPVRSEFSSSGQLSNSGLQTQSGCGRRLKLEMPTGGTSSEPPSGYRSPRVFESSGATVLDKVSSRAPSPTKTELMEEIRSLKAMITNLSERVHALVQQQGMATSVSVVGESGGSSVASSFAQRSSEDFEIGSSR